MTIASILVLLLILFCVGALAYWVIRRFFPAGLPQTISLFVVGALLLYVLIDRTIGLGFLNTSI